MKAPGSKSKAWEHLWYGFQSKQEMVKIDAWASWIARVFPYFSSSHWWLDVSFSKFGGWTCWNGHDEPPRRLCQYRERPPFVLSFQGGFFCHVKQKKQKGNGRICTNDDVFFRFCIIYCMQKLSLVYLLDLTCFLSLPMDPFRFPNEPAKGESRTSYREAAVVRSLAQILTGVYPQSLHRKTRFFCRDSAKRFDSGR